MTSSLVFCKFCASGPQSGRTGICFPPTKSKATFFFLRRSLPLTSTHLGSSAHASGFPFLCLLFDSRRTWRLNCVSFRERYSKNVHLLSIIPSKDFVAGSVTLLISLIRYMDLFMDNFLIYLLALHLEYQIAYNIRQLVL